MDYCTYPYLIAWLLVHSQMAFILNLCYLKELCINLWKMHLLFSGLLRTWLYISVIQNLAMLRIWQATCLQSRKHCNHKVCLSVKQLAITVLMAGHMSEFLLWPVAGRLALAVQWSICMAETIHPVDSYRLQVGPLCWLNTMTAPSCTSIMGLY